MYNLISSEALGMLMLERHLDDDSQYQEESW